MSHGIRAVDAKNAPYFTRNQQSANGRIYDDHGDWGSYEKRTCFRSGHDVK
jgi:hypothetical protein